MSPRPAAGVPDAGVAVPEAVATLASGEALQPVWRNELGGLTFRAVGDQRTRYIKWQPKAGLTAEDQADVDLLAEAKRLSWASQLAAVPRVVEAGADDDAAWLVTVGLEARSAYHPRWRAEPEAAVRAIASGLRQLHEALPVGSCPFTVPWLRGREGLPAQDRLVVCHWDACVPNTLLDDDGTFAAHVDLGSLGVADRWADLAIATASISWEANFGRRYDELFFAAYGVAPDPERLAYYRRLWED